MDDGGDDDVKKEGNPVEVVAVIEITGFLFFLKRGRFFCCFSFEWWRNFIHSW